MKNAGYVTNTTNVTVAAGKTVTYTAKMLPIQAVTGTIVIKSRPSGATVFLDSVDKGYSPDHPRQYFSGNTFHYPAGI